MARPINLKINIWRKLLFLHVILFAFIHCLAQERKDTITLYNGQTLVGEIKGASLGELTIDDVDLKILELKQYKIKSIRTYRRFKIETRDKEIHFGIISPSTKPGNIILKLDDGQVIEMSIMNLNNIIVLRKNFFKQVDGNLSLGFSYAKSSDLGQLNFSSNSDYETKSFQFLLRLNMIGSIDSSRYSRDREDAGFFTSYNFYKTTWIATAGFAYQRNLELSLARRYQQFFGGGNKIFLRKYWQLVASSGITINQERSTDGIESGPLYEVPTILRFDFYKYSRPNIQITSTHNVFFSLTQKGRIRYDGSLSFSWEIIRRFYFTINPYLSYDNKPSQGGNTLDYGSAISITFRY